MGCTGTKGSSVAPVLEPQPATLMPSGDKDRLISTMLPDQSGDNSILAMASTPQGCAFEVVLAEPKEDVIKKHPPKRIQRLEDQQLAPLTKELIKEKQEGAEQRRIELLNKRIQSAKSRHESKRRYIQTLDSSDLMENLDREPSTVAL